METIEKTCQVPSAGVFGGPEEVTIRPMSTLEEKLLYTSRDVSFIEKIVKQCVVKPENLNIEKLHPNDVIYLLFMIRELTFGPEYLQSAVCQNCGLKQDMEINITDMVYNILDVDNLESLLTVELPKCKDTVHLKLLSVGDSNEITKSIKRIVKNNKIDDEEGYSFIYRFARMIEKINDEEPKDTKEAIEYLSRLHMVDFAAIKDALDKIKIGIDTTLYYDCKKCHEEVEVIGAIVPEFFRPTEY